MTDSCPTCGKMRENPDAAQCPRCGAGIGTPPTPVAASGETPAGVWDRFGAYVVDYIIGIILMVLIFIASVVVSSFLPERNYAVIVLGIIVALLVYLLYYAYFESSERQATPGKMLVKIKVTGDDGRPLTFPRSLGRSFLKILFTISPVSLLALLHAIIIHISDRKKGLHDYIAGTRVVTAEGHDNSGATIIIIIAAIVVVFVMITVLLAAVIAAFVFGMAGQIETTKVVAATVQEINTDHIIVTYQGGQDAGIVRQLTATVTDSQNRIQTKRIGGEAYEPEPVPVGTTLEFSGDFKGKDHVVATALFTDGSEQVILDTVV